MTYAAQNFPDDGRDLEPRGPRLSGILQAMSQELTPGSKYLPGAKVGDIKVCFEDGSTEVFSNGVSIITLMFAERVVEWAPRGSMTPPITHYRMPLDAEWREVNGRRACIRSSTGNRCERTIYQFGLVNGFRVTFVHRSTGFKTGQDLGEELARIKVPVDGAMTHVCGAKYRLYSELTPPNDRGERWYALCYTRLGVLGEPNGPTIEEVRIARDIRAELRAEEERQKQEFAALSQVKPTAALPRAGSTTFTTGIGPAEAARSWAAPRPADIVDPKPPKTIDPNLNDDLNDMPWNK
jgi:hypothetical protein